MRTHFKESEEKISNKILIIGVIIVAILVTGLIISFINLKTNKEEDIGILQSELGKIDDNDYETVSIDIGKSINEVQNEIISNTVSDEKNSNLTNSFNNSKSTNKETKKVEKKENITDVKDKEEESNEEKNKTEEIKFSNPIKGEIIREFAPDSLVYSPTLEEWVTHNGIDIKADKTSVVKSAEKGTIYAKKNDPRYGLTVIVNHDNGYQTVYANLLTAEYVVEGEQIEVGQTIGTVGNTANFEIADDYHLHFELIKDGEYENPCDYMDF